MFNEDNINISDQYHMKCEGEYCGSLACLEITIY